MTFLNKNNRPLEHWHIEISGKCPIKCPRCTRQELPGFVNSELSLDWFIENFTPIVSHVKKVTFCGDDGDPIYAKDLIQVIAWLKKQNKDIQIVVITNGSYKTSKWWKELDSYLDIGDHIHFSIDGWDQESNNLYRVNCDWKSIMQGANEVKNAIKTWAAIAFKFNETKLSDMKIMAKELNFDYFQLTYSSKFGVNYQAYPKDDPLQPSSKFVSTDRFKRTIEHISERQWNDKLVTESYSEKFDKMQDTEIKPLCWIGNKGLYVNSVGKFFPCCWTGLRYSHTANLFPYIDYSKTFIDVVDDTSWTALFNSFSDNTCPSECKSKCGKHLWSYEHATQW